MLFILAVLAATVLSFLFAMKKRHTPMMVLSVIFGLCFFHYDIPGELIKIGSLFSTVLVLLLLAFSVMVSNDKG